MADAPDTQATAGTADGPRIVLEQLVSADGFAAEPDGGMRFVEAVSFDDADRTDEHQLDFVGTVDAIVLGRVTYEMFANYWPTADPKHDRLAGPMNTLPKYVLSETLQSAPWGETEAQIVRGGLAGLREAIQPYRKVVAWGSLMLSRALLAANLVDTIRLRTVPSFVGEGLTFTPPTTTPLVAKLGDQWRYSTGHVTTEYHLRD
ncbi:dihydrofolate reductase family protein [Parenemella sanctibonifatiensis]|uniref:Reductase n=1 Tax=Parenemella sanctibonifatiensis TaxID=2016505 RepID=A0A255EEW3_9ACTN|nr:dihydrofolate reductase family protein [Parenemella sanctibonifatiensis]OYN87942.1 reductase [Parenemella sanctibonifatiensis]